MAILAKYVLILNCPPIPPVLDNPDGIASINVKYPKIKKYKYDWD